MKPYIDWLKEDGFWVSSTWDEATNSWTGPGKFVVFPIHEKILGHALTPDENGHLPYTTIILGFPKKTGKSVMGASILAWAMDQYGDGTEIYALANDLEQAEGIIFQDLTYHIEKKYGIRARNHKIVLPNGSFVQALSHHYRTASGTRHSVTIFDELWAFNTEKSRRLWAEMTPIPTVKNPLRIIVTYAGFSEDDSPLRDLYERVVRDGEVVLPDLTDSFGNPVCFADIKSRTFCAWHTEPTMPWQTAEYYAEQEASLRPEEFLRLHRNQWVSTRDLFIPKDWWERAIRLPGPMDLVRNHPFRNSNLVVAVDAGLKVDNSAVVGCYYSPNDGHIGVAFHRIWKPVKGETLDLEDTIERYVIEKAATFNIVEIAYDPSQLQRSMMTLRKAGLPVLEYPQTQVNMLEITNTLYDIFKHDLLDVYDENELREHVLRATIQRNARGILFKKLSKSGGNPFDAAVALAMAVTRAFHRGVTMPEGNYEWEIPFSDEGVSGWEAELLRKIPAQLRPTEFDDPSIFDL